MSSNVEQELNKFGKYLVKNSRANLTRKKKNASGELYKSIDYNVEVFPNSFSLEFIMAEHGEYIDAGVKGAGGTKADGSKWKTKRVTNNKFKYTNKKPPVSVFSGWSVRRGLAPRDKGGRFTSRKGLQFALANSVFHTGLETTDFYTRPFELGFKKLPEDLAEAYALDVEQLLQQSLKK